MNINLATQTFLSLDGTEKLHVWRGEYAIEDLHNEVTDITADEAQAWMEANTGPAFSEAMFADVYEPTTVEPEDATLVVIGDSTAAPAPKIKK